MATAFPKPTVSFYYCLIYAEFQIFSNAASLDARSISDLSNLESVTLSPSTVRVQALPAQQVAAPPVPPTPPVPPPVPQVVPQAGSSTSSRWYIVTVGRATGVFQGW